jgi:hypothetical protein
MKNIKFLSPDFALLFNFCESLGTPVNGVVKLSHELAR